MARYETPAQHPLRHLRGVYLSLEGENVIVNREKAHKLRIDEAAFENASAILKGILPQILEASDM